MSTDINDLIDHAALTAAAERLTRLQSRLDAARATLPVAEAAVAAAEQVLRQAVLGDGDVTVTKARAARDKAIADAEFQVGVIGDLEHAVAVAQMRDVPAARAAAHDGVFKRAVAMRLAACKKADEARALMAEADTDTRAADRLLVLAAQNDHGKAGEVQAFLMRPNEPEIFNTRPEEVERLLLADLGIVV